MVQVWFEGGPAHGAIRWVSCREDGLPPGMVAWRADGVFVGVSSSAAPAGLIAYLLDPTPRIASRRFVYRFAGALQR